jgi:hypothetical protein
MLFLLIYSDIIDVTTYSSAKVVVLLPISMTKLSQEVGKEHNRLTHFSLVILISIEDNCIIMVLNTFKCLVTELPSLILRRYSFFFRNNLFSRDFDWYKLPNLSHNFLVNYSPKTFISTKYAIQSQITVLVIFSSLSHSSIDIHVDMVPRQIVVHCYQSTRRYSISIFQSSKFQPLNFLISILELLVII